MIQFDNLNNDEPYKILKNLYQEALEKGQKSIEAISISSFNANSGEVDSRFVNLKYIIDDEWIFFSNYTSKKSEDFESHPQISALFFWESINVQIRIKAEIKKTNSNFSNQHFSKRSFQKNVLAIASNQSSRIANYDDVIKKFEKLSKKNSTLYRPDYWGGYSFIPYYFEFWEGQEYRLNKRQVFLKSQNIWKSEFLEP